MKRSTQVAAPLLAAAALAITTGCRHPEMQRCVDEQNHVVAQSFCQANGIQQTPTAGMGYFPRYRYYYGGGGGWNLGSTVYGGGYTSMGGHAYTTSSGTPHAESFGGHIGSGSTTRGGFGSSFGGGSGSSTGTSGGA